MEKYEENTRLKEYFEYYINQMSVDETYHPLLVDILMRRAYEFKLRPEEIQQDVSSLVNNLKTIRIGKMPEGYESAAGIYSSVDKEIVLEEGIVEDYKKSKNYQTLYEILTHEIYHALSRDENGFDRLASQNSLTGYYNSTLLEAIVEKAADRTVFSRGTEDQNAPYYHQNYFGYPNITFITDALAACYGTSEKHFLKNAILGRERLTSVLDSIADQEHGAATAFLDGIEVSFAVLHKNFYGKDENNNPIKPNAEEVLDSMESMYRLCEWKMQARMENLKLTSVEQAEMAADFFKYNHNKLFIVMRDAAKGFENSIGNNLETKFLDGTYDQRRDTLSRISDFSQIIANKDKIRSEEELLRLVNLAKSGMLGDDEIERLEYLGIKLKEPEEIFEVSEEFLGDRREEDFAKTKWDAKKIEKITKKAFPRKRFSERMQDTLNKFKGKIKSFFEPEPKALGPGEGDAKIEQSENQKGNKGAFAALTPEQLETFNKGAAQVVNNHNRKNETDKTIEQENIKGTEDGPDF